MTDVAFEATSHETAFSRTARRSVQHTLSRAGLEFVSRKVKGP